MNISNENINEGIQPAERGQDIANLMYPDVKQPVEEKQEEQSSVDPIEPQPAAEAKEDNPEPPPDQVEKEEPVKEEGGEEKTAESSEENPPQGDKSEDEEEGETIQSFSQLVEHEDWDPEWADNLTLETKIDGEMQSVTIGQLKGIYQTQEAASKRLDDAKAEATEVRQELDQQKDTQAKELAAVAGLAAYAEQFFGLDKAEARLDEIRKTQGDAAYLVAKDQVKDLQSAIGQIRQVAGQNMEEVLGHLKKTMTGELTPEETEVRASEQNQLLLDRIPAWKEDNELAQKESGEMVEYIAEKYGYSDDEIKGALDHRLWDLARKAMLYDQKSEKAEATRKRVLRIPKVLKGGGEQKPANEGGKDPVAVMYGAK